MTVRHPSRREILAAAVAATLWPAAARSAPRVHRIVMAKMAFGPVPPDLKVGDAIEWVNQDIFRHTATAADGSFDVDLNAGARGRTELGKPGTIPFRCRYHPGMTGRLVIGE